jgi:AraC-like DNA-binding protein
MARVAGLSQAHFSREFQRAFGEPPYRYLLARRLERAAALLRTTDWPISRVCTSVGWQSLGSFTTSFTTTFGVSPARYRAAMPPAQRWLRVPMCVLREHGRPSYVPPGRAVDQNSRIREDDGVGHP